MQPADYYKKVYYKKIGKCLDIIETNDYLDIIETNDYLDIIKTI